MARTKGSSSKDIQKISFGKKKEGHYKKSYGPKEQRPKKYRGQGK